VVVVVGAGVVVVVEAVVVVVGGGGIVGGGIVVVVVVGSVPSTVNTLLSVKPEPSSTTLTFHKPSGALFTSIHELP
jgi:hypothetical protein